MTNVHIDVQYVRKRADKMEDILSKLQIKNESLFLLEREFVNFPSDSAKVYSLLAEANKVVLQLKLRLEMVTSQVVKEIFEEYERGGKPLASSSRAEVRKTMVPLDGRYIKARRGLNEAISTKETLEATAKGFESKGYMLKELGRLSDRTHFNEPSVYKGGSDRGGDEKVTEENKRVAEDLLITE